MRRQLLLCSLVILISSSFCDPPPGYDCGPRCTTRGYSAIRQVKPRRSDYEYHGLTGYKLHVDAKNWTEARQICYDEGAHLAVITNKTEYEILQDLYKKGPAIKSDYRHTLAFVGLNDIFQEGEWYSIFDQHIDEIGWSEWDTLSGVEQPNNGSGQASQNCGALLKHGFLDDFWCDHKLPFFCKRNAGE